MIHLEAVLYGLRLVVGYPPMVEGVAPVGSALSESYSPGWRNWQTQMARGHTLLSGQVPMGDALGTGMFPIGETLTMQVQILSPALWQMVQHGRTQPMSGGVEHPKQSPG